ncbi:hypothetical protein [Pseudaestuariivita sp.]|uniref:hypothetical protein n=1 Tax=Pseudaestuariivita sp. TaxID=2211669 RepID=UPI004059EC6A
MPEHLMSGALADGRLARLVLAQDSAPPEEPTFYAAHLRSATPGPAARYLLDTPSGLLGLRWQQSRRRTAFHHWY